MPPLFIKLGLDLGRHFFVCKLLMCYMTPHILIEPELLHLFNTDSDRDALCMSIVEVLETMIRSEFKLVQKDRRKSADGTCELPNSLVESTCVEITPKLEVLVQKFIDNSKYSDKITVELNLNKNRLVVYMSSKYYTGFSSSLH